MAKRKQYAAIVTDKQTGALTWLTVGTKKECAERLHEWADANRRGYEDADLMGLIVRVHGLRFG